MSDDNAIGQILGGELRQRRADRIGDERAFLSESLPARFLG